MTVTEAALITVCLPVYDLEAYGFETICVVAVIKIGYQGGAFFSTSFFVCEREKLRKPATN